LKLCRRQYSDSRRNQWWSVDVNKFMPSSVHCTGV